jgi:dihydrofolate reductase
MTRLRIHTFSISLDGYGAGASQSVANPLGVGGEHLHDWFVPASTFQRMVGKQGGTTGVDDDFAARGIANIGAWIVGRNMFGPIRGTWQDDACRARAYEPRDPYRAEEVSRLAYLNPGAHARILRA